MLGQPGTHRIVLATEDTEGTEKFLSFDRLTYDELGQARFQTVNQPGFLKQHRPEPMSLNDVDVHCVSIVGLHSVQPNLPGR
jgi:hypothetical protein